MCKILMQTKEDISAFILRVTLGIVFFPHGAQKALGLFGGHGFKATVTYFTDNMHIPLVLALLVVAAEFLGSIALVLGFLTRLSAFGIAAIMATAIFMVHSQNGFFMNWSGTQKGEGFEYHLLALAIATALIIKGGGSFSLDRKISK